jgi:phosphatidylinositol alpha-1,6-mannosyltransferase
MSRLAEHLAAKGQEVVVVGPSETGWKRYDASATYRILRYAPLRRPLEVLAIAVTYLRALSVSRARPTIASVWWPVALALVFVPRALRGPVVILVHGTEVCPSRKGVRNAIMRAVFRRADAIIANSRFTSGLLRRAGVTGDIHVVSLGVDMAPIPPARAANPVVLSVGRLVARKGFDRVIDALPALCAQFPALRYEIAGSGPERLELEKRAARLGVGGHVTFLGSVTEDELRDAYARAWCFALPVRNIDDDVEGFGIVYLEAAMASLPSVGGIDSGATDAIEDGTTGVLVDGTSVTAVREAIASLLEDRERAEQMGACALDRARAYTWERTTDQILALLPRGAMRAN